MKRGLGKSFAQLGLDIDGEAAGDWSGRSVSLSADGSIVAIGAGYNDGTGSDAGHVRLYQWDGSAWNQLGSDIDGEAAGDWSGRSVSLSADGSIVAIGANFNSWNNRGASVGRDAGHVRLYQWDGSAWNQLGLDIDGEAAIDQSGTSVSLSADGSIVAIGARYNDGTGSAAGHVRIFDLEDPTIAISSDATSLKAGETATLTFTLSESSSDFVASDVTVSGGKLSSFSGLGTSYSATFTPTASSTTNGVISVASSKFSDAAGNTNSDGSDSNNTITLSVDTTRPTIAISSDATSLKAGETATLTFTLSESSSDFVASDVTVSGGKLSSFSGLGTSYSATFTPTASSTTNGVISVASSKFSDAAGNTNSDGSDSNNTITLSVDTIREPEDYILPTTKKTIKGTNKDDKLKGTNKKDLIIGKNGDDKLTGSKGSDVLQGDGGNDRLIGSKGKDYLDGSKGIDILIGGKGADVFQISKGVDLVEDFSIKQGDRIALDKKGKYTIVDNADGVLVMANAKKQLFLEGIDYDDVIAAGVDLFVRPI